MSRALSDPRAERGNALVEVTWLGVLLLMPLLWIVLSVFQVQRGTFAVSAASRAAGRAFALAPDDTVGRARAQTAADQALTDQHLTTPAAVEVTCTPRPQDCHSPASVITVRLRSQVTLPWLPWVLGGGAPSFALAADATVPLGRFRE